MPANPTRRDWARLLHELARQLDDGRVYNRELCKAAALHVEQEAYSRRPDVRDRAAAGSPLDRHRLAVSRCTQWGATRPTSPPLPDVPAGRQLLLTPEEAAKVLRVGRTTVYALMKAGELQPVHIGRSCRLSHAELQRFAHRLETPAPAEPPRRGRRGRTRATQSGLFDLASDADVS